jgi:phosphatidylinositol alpha-mannosyltransferase
MNIVIVSQSYYPRPGGVTEHVHHTALELRRRGHDVTIVTANFGNGTDPDPNVIHLGRNVLVPINGAWVNMTVGPSLSRRLRHILEKLEPDIIHTHCPLAPTLPLMTLHVASGIAPVIGTFHAAARRSLGYSVFRDQLARSVEKLHVRIAVSRAALDLANAYFPGSFTLIPNGVDCNRFSTSVLPFPGLRDGAFNILYVGRLDKRKGVKYLLRAAAAVGRDTPERTRLVIVGDDGPRRHLLPRVSKDIEIVFTGAVPKEVLPRYFASGDVLCSPAVDRESFGIVLLEGMASGLPVVATSIPGYLTVLRDRWNSLVVPPRNPGALARAIIEIRNDAELRRTLRRNGTAYARRFHWEGIVSNLESVYMHTLDPRWQRFSTVEPLRESPIQA